MKIPVVIVFWGVIGLIAPYAQGETEAPRLDRKCRRTAGLQRSCPETSVCRKAGFSHV